MTELERKVEALILCVGREKFDKMIRELPAANAPAWEGTEDIVDLLVDLGAPSATQGFDYLVSAIDETIRNPQMGVHRKIYEKIGNLYGVNYQNAVGYIRKVVVHLFTYGDTSRLYEMFGASIPADRGYPKPMEFIDRVARFIAAQRARSENR